MKHIARFCFIICCIVSVGAFGAEQPPVESALPELMLSCENNYWQPGTYAMVDDDTADITIDQTVRYQNWEGFGGTYNEKGWDALQVVSSEIPRAMSLLFSKEDGCGFVYGRIPIGASDYAMSWYTLAETANDYAMNDFSIARDREMLIPYIKASLEVNPDVHLWGSPWVCPGWMKSGMNFKNDQQTMEAYALYFARFVEEYAKEGLVIEAVHHQNEPGYGQVKWTVPQYVSFLRDYLGPKFEERSIETEVWCGTMSHPDDAQIAIACMNDAEAMKYVVGFGLQWNHVGTVDTLSKGGRVWQTEHRCGNYNFEADYWDESRYDPNKAQNDHLYGEESWQLIRDWVGAGVNSYCAWNMVLDTYGASLGNWHQNALLVVDRQARELIITPAYWVFRHYSQYIEPGATQVGSSGFKDAIAFENPDGKVVVQLYNKEETDLPKNISIGADLYQVTIPSHGWATLAVKPSTAAKEDVRKQLTPDANRIRITSRGDAYRVELPLKEAGRIELIDVAGRVVASAAFPKGSAEVMLPKAGSRNGLLIVRVVTGEQQTTARFFTAR